MFSARTSFIVLLAVTAISLVALIALGWRSLDAFESTIARVLLQASVYTAEQTAQQIQRDLRSPVFDLLEQIDHAAIRSYDVPQIAKTLQAAGAQHFELVHTYFVWSYAGMPHTHTPQDLEQRVLFYSKSQERAPPESAAPSPASDLGFFLNPRLASAMVGEAERLAQFQKPFALSYLQFEGQ